MQARVCTRNEQETAVRGTIGSRKSVLLPAKWHLTRGGTRSMITQGVVTVASRSNEVKTRKRKLGEKV
jgi:hypothetical protein